MLAAAGFGAALTVAGPVTTGVSSASGAAGNDLGDAATLTGSATATIGSALAQDWWVVWPSTVGGSVTVRVSDTTPSGQACDGVSVQVSDTNGSLLTSGALAPGQVFATPFNRAGSDRYFVEVDDFDCNPSGQPVTATVDLVSGGGGTPSAPSGAAAPAATSIGFAQPPLQGGTAYTGDVASGSARDWFVLDKATGADPATVRVENPTVSGSTTCASLDVLLTNTDGGLVDSAALADNTAVTFTVSTPGRYYLEVDDFDCQAGGTAYSIEPEPAAGWQHPPAYPMATLPAGSSREAAGGPLAGGTTYTAVLASGSVTDWSTFSTDGSVPQVSVSVQSIGPSGSDCTAVAALLYSSTGSLVGSATLADDTGHEFLIDTAGTWYLEIDDLNCDPGNSPPPEAGVTITPSAGVGAQSCPAPALARRPALAAQGASPHLYFLVGLPGRAAHIDVTDATRDVMVGQRIALVVDCGTAAAPAPYGWTIQGETGQLRTTSAVAGYEVTATTGTPRALTAGQLHGAGVVFEFVRTGAFSVSVGTGVGTATTHFHVEAPAIANPSSAYSFGAVWTSDRPYLSPEHHATRPPYLGLGLNPRSGDTPGVRWDWLVHATQLAHPLGAGDGAGIVGMVQLLYKQSTDETTPYRAADRSSFYHDQTVPVPAGGQNAWRQSDSPFLHLTNPAVTYSIRFEAWDYVMYRPDGYGSIWVPIGELIWIWGGRARYTATLVHPLGFWLPVEGSIVEPTRAGSPFYRGVIAPLPDWSTAFRE